MRIEDEALLAEFRNAGRCELCLARGPTDPHHLRCRGMGSGSRVDHRLNLMAVCRLCHTKIGWASLTIRGRRLTLDDLRAIVAMRENVTIEEVEDTINLILRLPRETTREQLAEILKGRPAA